MAPTSMTESSSVMRIVTPIVTHPYVHFVALLGLCAAYLQGGGQKLFDFGGAVGEAQHFGLTPAVPIAIACRIFLASCRRKRRSRPPWIARVAHERRHDCIPGDDDVVARRAGRAYKRPSACKRAWISLIRLSPASSEASLVCTE